MRCVTIEKLPNAASQNCADKNVRIENYHFNSTLRAGFPFAHPSKFCD
jgi:hypothetical protein